MDDLNKHQLVLLTLLVSFVTSTGASIITIALLNQDPPSVPPAVNRVIERTIERVVPSEEKKSDAQPQVTTITKEVQVAVKEDDLITTAVEKNVPKVGKVYPFNPASTTPAYTTGVLFSRDGLFAVERGLLLSSEGVLAAHYTVVFPTGVSATGTPVVAKGEDVTPNQIVFLRLDGLTGTPPDPVSWYQSDPKLGQTVIAIGGDEGDEVFKTAISRVVKGTTGEGTSTVEYIKNEQTNPQLPTTHRSGLVVNLDGRMIGMVVRSSTDGIVIYPVKRIVSLIEAQSTTDHAEAPTLPQG